LKKQNELKKSHVSKPLGEVMESAVESD